MTLTTGCAGGEETPETDVDHLRRLLAQNDVGPLPLPEPVSEELFELGRLLFFEKELAGTRNTSCATCHHPGLGTSDHRSLDIGVHGEGMGPERLGTEVGPRHAQALWNLHALSDGLSIDSRADKGPDGYVRLSGQPVIPYEWQDAAFGEGWWVAAGQAIGPVTLRQEMAGHPGEPGNEVGECPDFDLDCVWERLWIRLQAIPAYVDLFEAAYPGTAMADMNMGYVGNAIGAFEVHGFFSNESRWDRFVGRYDPETGELVPADDSALTEEEVRGAIRFYEASEGNCVACHAGSGFTDQKFHRTLAPQFGPGGAPPIGDGPTGLDDYGRYRVSRIDADLFAWRTAPLRNLGETYPYGRQGHYTTLEKFVSHYIDPEQALIDYGPEEIQDENLRTTLLDNTDLILSYPKDRLLDEVHVEDEEQVAELVGFLNTLNDENPARFEALVPDELPSGLPVDRP